MKSLISVSALPHHKEVCLEGGGRGETSEVCVARCGRLTPPNKEELSTAGGVSQSKINGALGDKEEGGCFNSERQTQARLLGGGWGGGGGGEQKSMIWVIMT